MTQEAAVVVGVGPGLGSALVRKLAGEGYTVIAAARKASDLAGLDSIEGNVVPYDCDATEAYAVEQLFSELEDEHGPLRVAVFNAGTYAPGTVTETSPEEFERCWRVGCFAGFLVGQAAAKLMIPHETGTIIFTGATASLRGGAGFVNLASPKFALRALAQSMARELGRKGIHVAHVIIDGQIHLERYAHLLEDRGPDSLLEPDAIADAYLDLHHQNRTAWTQEIDLRPFVEKF